MGKDEPVALGTLTDVVVDVVEVCRVVVGCFYQTGRHFGHGGVAGRHSYDQVAGEGQRFDVGSDQMQTYTFRSVQNSVGDADIMRIFDTDTLRKTVRYNRIDNSRRRSPAYNIEELQSGLRVETILSAVAHLHSVEDQVTDPNFIAGVVEHSIDVGCESVGEGGTGDDPDVSGEVAHAGAGVESAGTVGDCGGSRTVVAVG